MRYVSVLLLACLLLAAAPSAVAQDGPVFYMTQYKIQQARMDSLAALTQQYDVPWHNHIADNVEGYKRWHMRHDTGNEYNFMTVTRYPNWDMVRGDEIAFNDFGDSFAASLGMTTEELEAEDGMVNEAFTWAYEDNHHIDQIWRPVANAVQSGDEGDDMTEDMVLYMTQYKIMPSRLDSLVSLTQSFDAEWHEYVANNVDGYHRHWMRHDTGNEYNFLIITRYPNWDMVDSMPYDDLFPQWLESKDMTEDEFEAMGMQAKFQWTYEGAEHMDQIWRPIVPDDM